VTRAQVYKQLVDLFPYALTCFIEELLGVFLTPYVATFAQSVVVTRCAATSACVTFPTAATAC
jgi:hypothetical protein